MNQQDKGLSHRSALCDRLARQIETLRECESRYHRETGSVALLAVSKTKPVQDIQAALHCGQTRFGENYAQELDAKAEALADAAIEWHFIGPIQSNKTRIIAARADWTHSVDRLKTATRLSRQRPEGAAPLQVCIQVNIDAENTKSGVSLDQLPALCAEVVELPNLVLRGLMCIPRPSPDFDQNRRQFARLRKALESLNAQGYALDTLSMGMSGDFPAAIAEGATIVRIGTAIFGARGISMLAPKQACR